VRMSPRVPPPVTASPPAEPWAEQRPQERTLHDVRLVDEYAWLKAENWREVMRDPFQLDPAIRAYLQAERQGLLSARRHAAFTRPSFARMAR
jgi:protease II